jgi:hypothetical protein
MKDCQKDQALACFLGVSDSNPRRRLLIELQCLHTYVDVVFKRDRGIGAESDFDPSVFSLKKIPTQEKPPFSPVIFSM